MHGMETASSFTIDARRSLIVGNNASLGTQRSRGTSVWTDLGGGKFEAYEVVNETMAQRKTNKTSIFDSRDFHPDITPLYKKHVTKRRTVSGMLHKFQKWTMMAAVGVVMGVLVAFIENAIKAQTSLKRSTFHQDYHGSATLMIILLSLSINLGFAFISSAVVVWIQPVAGGSGVSEVMGELNGVHLPGAFRLRTLAVKLVSVVFAVSSGLPVGLQGPLIHIGAMLGQGLSQGRSKALGFQFKQNFFESMRNDADQYDFVVTGAAVGVTAAFYAPLGGLLLVMESMAAWWDHTRLTAAVFTATVLTAFMQVLTNVLLFRKAMPYAIPDKQQNGGIWAVWAELVIVLMALLIGISCGLLASVWIALNTYVANLRRQWIKNHWLIVEVCTITLFYSTVTLLAPFALPCMRSVTDDPIIPTTPDNALSIGSINVTGTSMSINQLYCAHEYGTTNIMASLVQRPGRELLMHLWNNAENIEEHPGYALVNYVAVLWLLFIGSATAVGSAVCGGMVTPSLTMGSLAGTIIACTFRYLGPAACAHMPIGTAALVGAGAFLAGTSRLSVSLTVMLIEMTGNTSTFFPLIVAIQSGKMVAHLFSHAPINHSLHLKKVPMLHELGRKFDRLHALTPKDVMADPVVVEVCVTRSMIADALRANQHQAFPVVKDVVSMHLVGVIPRRALQAIVDNGNLVSDLQANDLNESVKIIPKRSSEDEMVEVMISDDSFDSCPRASRNLSYSTYQKQYEKEYLPIRPKAEKLRDSQESSATWEEDPRKFSIMPLVNVSPFTVEADSSLFNTCKMFRSLQLRHLIVKDGYEVVGIITRKDILKPKLRSLLKSLDDKLKYAATAVTVN